VTAIADRLDEAALGQLAALRIRLGQHQEQKPGRPVPVVFRPPADPAAAEPVTRVCGECGRPLEPA
jgi:hypothetical protein